MQKILAFLVLLMLPWAARGQVLADWYYWFDTDAAPRDSGKVSEQQFQLQTDVSHLPTGAHTLYVQVADTAGVFSPPLGKFFFKVPDISSIDKLFYTIDTEEEAHALDFGNGTFSLDVSTYPMGFHSISLQVMDKEGGVSSVMPYLFYKVPTDGRLSRFRYWFDNDRTILEQPYGQGHYFLDVSELIPGLHFVNYFVIDGANSMSDVQSAAFFRQSVEQNQKLYYWFAGDTIATRIDNFRDGFVLDVTNQMEGFNTIYFQMEDNGTTDIQTEHYIKVPQTEGAGDMTVLCIIDGKIASEDKLPNLGGVIKWDMDVSTMDVGMHKALFQVITPSGSGSSIAESYFLRTLTNAEVATMQCSYIIDGFKHYVQKGISVNGTFHFDLPVEEMEDGLHRMDYMLVAENGVTTTQGSAWFFKTPVGGNGITQYDYWLNNKSDEVVSVTLSAPADPFQLIKLLPVTAEPIRSSCFHFDCKSGNPMMYAKNDIHFRFHDKSGRWVDADNQYVDYNVSQEVTGIADLLPTQTFENPDSNCVKWFSFDVAPGDTAAFKLSQAATVQVFAPSGAEVFKTTESASVNWSGIHTWEDGTYYLAVHDVTGSKETMTLEYMHMDKYDVVDWDVHTVGNGGCSTITFKGNGFRDLYAVDLVIAPGDTIHSVDVSHDSDAETAVTFDFTDATLGEYKAVFHFTEEDKPVANVVTVEEAVDIELTSKMIFASQYLRGSSNTYTLKIENAGNMTAYKVPILLYVFTQNPDNLSQVSVSGYDVKKNYIELLGELYTSSVADSIELLRQSMVDLCHFVHEDSMEYIKGFPHAYFTALHPTLKPSSTEEMKFTIKASARTYVYAWVPEEIETDYSGKKSVKAIGIRKTKKGCSNIDMVKAVECINRATPGAITHPGMKIDCTKIPPDCPHPDGGSSTPQPPSDPNDIYGYLSEAGSKFIADSVARVNYTIEFENDTTFATAAAHTILIKDTLDSRYFDLSKFMPTGIRIGEHETFLDEADVVTKNNVTSFVKTIDMRPEIYAIAQVDGTFNHATGIAQWTFQSLDPMTMEPTDDLMQGILPVNYNGTSGIGEVMFEVGMKQGKADGTEINNRAGIVFDYEEAILTPTWTNIVDAVAPSSVIDNSWMVNDSTLRVTADGFDERSGVWKYTWYVQAGENAPWWKEGETESPQFDYHIFEGIDYGFCVVATDSAGNVEQKVIERERGFKTYGQDYEDKIESLTPDPSPKGEGSVYDLSGRRLAAPRRGINVIDDKKVLKQ